MVKGRSSSMGVMFVSGLFACLWVGGASCVAAVPAYGLVGTYDSGVPGGLTGAMGLRSDGRFYQVVGDDVYVQAGVNSPSFARIGSLPAGSADAFGAAFISASPDGSLLAIGNGKFGAGAGVNIVGTASLSTSMPSVAAFVGVPNYSAAWAGNSTLYVTGFGGTSQVARVDLMPAAAATTVLTSVGGASGGIAVGGGNLFVGSGFGAGVGDVRSFPLATINAATSSLGFTSGAFVVNAFTAGTIDFDAAGNIILTGQSFSSGNGVAVIDLADGTRFNLPGLSPTDQYSAWFNGATGEILVRGFGSPTVSRFAVPGPGAAGVLVMGGVLAARRRRAGA